MATGRKRIQLKQPEPAKCPVSVKLENKLDIGVPVWSLGDVVTESYFDDNSFGAVKTAHHKTEPGLAALWATTIKHTSDECFAKLFLSDIELCQFKHKHILQIVALSIQPLVVYHEVNSFSFETYNQPIVVHNLADLLYQCDRAEVVPRIYNDYNVPRTVIDAVVSGLAFLHSKSVNCEQLTPQNIIIGQSRLDNAKEELVCKIGDFLQTRRYCEQTQTGLTTKSLANERQTVPFQPPEKLVYQGRYSDPGKTDVWCLGMVTFCVLNPDVPFPFYLEYTRSQAKDLRQLVIESLKQNKVPEMSPKYDIGKSEPHLVALMQLALIDNPEERPRVSDIQKCLIDGTGPTCYTLSNRPELLCDLLRSTECQALIRNALRSKSIKITIGSRNIVVYALTRKMAEDTVTFFNENFIHENIEVDTAGKPVLVSKKWESFLANHLEENKGLLQMKTNHDQSTVHICAAKVIQIVDKIKHFLEENTIVEKRISIPTEKMEFVETHLITFTKTIAQMPNLSFHSNGGDPFVQINGNMSEIKTSTDMIERYTKAIAIVAYALEKPALVWHFQQRKGEASLSEISRHHNAIIRMEREEGTFQSSLSSRCIIITAESIDVAKTCVETLKDLCKNIWLEKSVSYPGEKNTEDCRNQVLTIKRMAVRLHVDMDLEGDAIKLSGVGDQVNAMAENIYKVFIAGIEKGAAEKELAALTLLHTQVKWYYEVNGQFVEYLVDHNATLERAYTEGRHDISLVSNQGRETVNVRKMEGHNQSGTFRVLRQIQETSSEKLPAEWSKMGKTDVFMLVALSADSKEFNDVKCEILRTSQNKIKEVLKIERVQNPGLYRKYKVHREEMVKSGTARPIERQLWHGSDINAIASINLYGFDRGYCGKNATAFGSGVYFAANASYSYSYAKADSSGKRYMYHCNVLTGDFAQGHSSMRVTPIKNGLIKFDSVVDNTKSPSIFVIFNDAQAYPGYLITFK